MFCDFYSSIFAIVISLALCNVTGCILSIMSWKSSSLWKSCSLLIIYYASSMVERCEILSELFSVCSESGDIINGVNGANFYAISDLAATIVFLLFYSFCFATQCWQTNILPLGIRIFEAR